MDDLIKDAKKKYRKHAYRYRDESPTPKIDRRGHVVKMRLTFEEWFKIWLDSGHWLERGHKGHEYCMARNNDLGDYAIGNVTIKTITENITERNTFRTEEELLALNKKHSETKANKSEEEKRATAEKLSKSMKESKANWSDEFRKEVGKKYSEAKSMPCTVDGVTIFPSLTIMRKELGQGKRGTASPTFRFISKRA